MVASSGASSSLIGLILLKLITAQCPEEVDHGVVWSSAEINEFVMSSPQCLDSLRFPITRKCDGIHWTPIEPPKCVLTQLIASTDLYPVIPDYTLLELKLKLESARNVFYATDAGSPEDRCLKAGLRNDPALGAVYEMEDKWYWFPYQRPKDFWPFMVFRHRYTWGTVSTEYETIDDNCLVYNSLTSETKGERCDSSYPHLCAYFTELPLTNTGCPDGEFTTRFNPTKCFRVVISSHPLEDSSCERIFTFNSAFDKHILAALRKEFAVADDEFIRIQIRPFILDELYDEETWIRNIKNVEYSNWAPEILPEEKHKSGTVVADLNGNWRLLNDIHPVTICENQLWVREPQLILKFNAFLPTLTLIVYNQEFFHYFSETISPHIICFSTATEAFVVDNSEYSLLSVDVIRSPNGQVLQSVAAYKLNLPGNTPGQFWCTAVRLPDFEIISTPKILASSKGVVDNVLVFKFRVYCDKGFICHRYYVPPSDLDTLSVLFSRYLKDIFPEFIFGNTVVMEMLQFTAESMTVLVHSTVTGSITMKPLDLLSFEDPKDVNFATKINLIRFIVSTERRQFVEENGILLLEIESTFFCLLEVDDRRLFFGKVGEIVPFPDLCLNDDRMFNSWRCEGDFPFGTQFVGPQISRRPCNDQNVSDLTRMLFEIAISKHLTTIKEMQQLEDLIQNRTLDPNDVFLVGSILRNYAHNPLNDNVQDIETINNVFSMVQEISHETAIKSSRLLNATNIIVDFYEKIVCDQAAKWIPFDQAMEKGLDQALDQMGVKLFESVNAITIIVDPSVENVTGFALIRNDQNTDHFIQFLYANTSLDDLMENDLLLGASYFPENLFNRLQSEFNRPVNESKTPTAPLRFVFSIIKNDLLFRPSDLNVTLKPITRVITASIPGFHGSHLPFLYPILFRTPATADFSLDNKFECSFWNFHAGSGSSSDWSNEGCVYVSRSSQSTNPVVLCSCSHLTNFAFLMTGEVGTKNPSEKIPLDAFNTLDILTVIGCSLSIGGVTGIWMTAALFQSWRKKIGTQILLHLALAIAIQTSLIILLNFNYIFDWNRAFCIAIGVILHYSVLVAFAWMLVVAYLQFLRYVVVVGILLPKNLMLKAVLFGWGTPCIPVVIILLSDLNLYVPIGLEKEFNPYVVCYPQDKALYFGVILPVALIFSVNFVVFLWVAFSVTKGVQKQYQYSVGQKTLHRQQIRLIIFLVFALGLTWMFGLLVHIEGESPVFTYLFCVTASVQGLVLFVYFILMDPNTRALWNGLIMRSISGLGKDH